jgi:mRNA interferase MazF
MIDGVVLSDQVKSFDWRMRKIEFITKEPHGKIQEIISKLNVLLNI